MADLSIYGGSGRAGGDDPNSPHSDGGERDDGDGGTHYPCNSKSHSVPRSSEMNRMIDYWILMTDRRMSFRMIFVIDLSIHVSFVFVIAHSFRFQKRKSQIIWWQAYSYDVAHYELFIYKHSAFQVECSTNIFMYFYFFPDYFWRIRTKFDLKKTIRYYIKSILHFTFKK